MCGIAGVYHRDRHAGVDIALVRSMTDRLVHRGPDDGGVMRFGPCAFGHRRLSIVDLTPAGHQPMGTPDGRYWITFNGEIYNFQALREDMEGRGVTFRTRTDTEVLLQLYRLEGEGCLEHLNGMFAFAIYDRVEHRLFLARDRLGKKPLYIWDDGERVLFTSELKSFFADPSFRPTVDPMALVDFMSTLYVPDPRTIYQGVERLRPAHALTFSSSGRRERQYWQLEFRPAGARAEEDRPGIERAVDEFESLFADAVRTRMVADVPLGAFLSGGVDSSAVVSEMSRQANHTVKTTTIGFVEADADESPYAEEVARRFGCDHHTEPVRAHAAELLDTLLWHFDEPFADASALPTYLLSQATRKRVTVALSGDGGDEGFGGYEKYAAEMRERRIRAVLPPRAWRALSKAAGLAPLGRWPLWSRGANVLRTLSDDPASAYFRTQSFITPEALSELASPELRAAVRGHDVRTYTREAYYAAAGSDGLSAIQGVDIATYLPGDILTKVDRMSMAHALEVRCPLLDHRIIELALRMPPAFRLYRGEGKRVMKRSLERRLPRAFIDRPKHGFVIPVDAWFRGPLDGLVDASILGGGLRSSGLLNMDQVARLVREHRSGVASHGMPLWILLVLGVWYDRIRGRSEARPSTGAPSVIEEAAAMG